MNTQQINQAARIKFARTFKETGRSIHATTTKLRKNFGGHKSYRTDAARIDKAAYKDVCRDFGEKHRQRRFNREEKRRTLAVAAVQGAISELRETRKSPAHRPAADLCLAIIRAASSGPFDGYDYDDFTAELVAYLVECGSSSSVCDFASALLVEAEKQADEAMREADAQGKPWKSYADTAERAKQAAALLV